MSHSLMSKKGKTCKRAIHIDRLKLGHMRMELNNWDPKEDSGDEDLQGSQSSTPSGSTFSTPSGSVEKLKLQVFN